MIRIANAYQRRTGDGIVVTSGTRTPETQAAAMYAKLTAGGDFSGYREREAADQIRRMYTLATLRGFAAETIVSLMASVIRTQVIRGIYVSSHLRAGAVDVRSRTMSRKDRIAFREAARQEGVVAILEFKPPHWHLEF